MSAFAWGVVAHLVIALAVLGSATALQWNGDLNGSILAIYGTVIGLVGGSAITTVANHTTNSDASSS